MKVSFKGLVGALVIPAFVLLTPVASMATIYHCDTDQALKWEHGRLVENKHYRHVVLRFDDERWTAWWSLNSSPNVPSNPLSLKVLQKASAGDDLIAISDPAPSKHITGGLTLYIRGWDKETNGLVFMFTEYDNILSGHCKAER
jgi:hypothetical protein